MTVTTDDVIVVVKDLPMAHPTIVGYAEAHGVRISDIVHAVDGDVMNGLEYHRAISLLSRIIVVLLQSKIMPPTPGRSMNVMINRLRSHSRPRNLLD